MEQEGDPEDAGGTTATKSWETRFEHPVKVNFDAAVEMEELPSVPLRQERQARRMKITWGDA